jgi:hypothetical protein
MDSPCIRVHRASAGASHSHVELEVVDGLNWSEAIITAYFTSILKKIKGDVIWKA